MMQAQAKLGHIEIEKAKTMKLLSHKIPSIKCLRMHVHHVLTKEKEKKKKQFDAFINEQCISFIWTKSSNITSQERRENDHHHQTNRI